MRGVISLHSSATSSVMGKIIIYIGVAYIGVAGGESVCRSVKMRY